LVWRPILRKMCWRGFGYRSSRP